jgi:hypothetical protein
MATGVFSIAAYAPRQVPRIVRISGYREQFKSFTEH